MLPYTTYLYKDQDNWYVAKSNTGQIVSESNTSAETVIQAAMNRKGLLAWLPADYTVSGSFAGINLAEHTHILSSIDVNIIVPQGYTGGVLNVDPTARGVTIHQIDMSGGITINEAGTPARLWDGLLFKLNHASNGCCFCKFGPIFANNANNSVCIDMLHTNGWLTSAVIDRVTSYYTKNGFTVRNTVNNTNPGLSSLTVKDFWFQSHQVTEYGFKGILGRNWVFENCTVWDMQNSMNDTGAGVSAQFMPTCDDMLILGGIMMHHNVDNQAKPGKIRWLDSHSSSSDFQYIERSFSTNGSQTGSRNYTIPHGMGFTPDWVHVTPKSIDACTSMIRWTHDSTNIYVTYMGTPPPPSTPGNQNNVVFQYRCSVK